MPQRKCCEKTTPQSCLKGNVLRIQFSKIASNVIFWEYNSAELPQRKYFEKIQLHRVASKEMFWEYNSVKLP